MLPRMASAALLFLYLATAAGSGQLSAAAQSGTQTIIRPDAAETTLRRGAGARGEHAWSAWGAWGACSRTCGGGVSVQERRCLPGDDDRWTSGRSRRRLPPGSQPSSRRLSPARLATHNQPAVNPYRQYPPQNRIQVTEPKSGVHNKSEPPSLRRESERSTREYGPRNAREEEKGRPMSRRTRERRTVGGGCKGLDRRYHECNTAPCPGPAREPRAEQCSYYDRRPFKGRFYTWVPYVDAGSPCTLNCRPRGQQFYASLALAADGTPCTRPGFRAICVQGSCKLLGED